MKTRRGSMFTVMFLCALFVSSEAQDQVQTAAPERQLATIKPQYLPPSELLSVLGVPTEGNFGVIEWPGQDLPHSVEIRINDPANLLILSGAGPDIAYVRRLIEMADVPPRQIEIEVQIVEVNKSKARDVGIDWDDLWRNSGLYIRGNFRRLGQDQYTDDGQSDREVVSRSREITVSATPRPSQAIRLLDSSGAATIRNAPRILTLNNRRATILDGQRVTYVTRYSSYSNLFETDSMNAGLSLSVTPSLGESGYITMEIGAELTAISGDISGSPVKEGQMIENTVVVENGQTILLGGLTRTVTSKMRKRFPVLGHILPFLFSRESVVEESIESVVVLTPRVVDFNTSLDESTQELLERGASGG